MPLFAAPPNGQLPATPAPLRRDRFKTHELPDGITSCENIPNVTWNLNDPSNNSNYDDILQTLETMDPQYHIVDNRVLLRHIFSIPCPNCQTITQPQKLEMFSGSSISCHLVCVNCRTRSYYSTLPTIDGKVSSPTVLDDTFTEALLFSGSKVAGVTKLFDFLGIKRQAESGIYETLRDERWQIQKHVYTELDVLLEKCMFSICLNNEFCV